MSRILVNPDELRRVADRFRQGNADLRNVRWHLQGAAAPLDWEFGMRAEVESRIQESSRYADRLGDQVQGMADNLLRIAQAFAQADSAGDSNLESSGQLMLKMMADLNRYGAWAGLPGIPLWAIQRLVGVGSLLAPPGSTLLPGVLGLERINQAFRLWRDPAGLLPEPARKAAASIISLGLFMARGRTTTLYEVPTRFDGVSLAHLQSNGREVEFSLAHYEKEGDVGGVHLKGEVSAGKAEVAAGLLHSEVKAVGVEAKGEARLLGNEDVNAGVVLVGEAGVANAGYELDLHKGSIEAEAYTAAAEGDFYGKVKVFSLEGKLGVEGCVACAGVSFKFGAKGEVKLAVLGGLGLKWDFAKKKE